jgi:hypothetical protein
MTQAANLGALGTNAGTTGVLASAGLPTGSVLQVVQATYSTQVTYSSGSTSYTDTGLTASITPKFATSKILVMVLQQAYWYDISAPQDAGMSMQILRNGSSIFVSSPQQDNLYFYSPTGTSRFDFSLAYPMNYLDSPASTSALTYKVQAKGVNTDTRMIFQGSSSSSTVTFMEIAA